eukprot:COSAG01_NODE_3221_length_6395_cov_15.338945_2_plen_99_part_00
MSTPRKFRAAGVSILKLRDTNRRGIGTSKSQSKWTASQAALAALIFVMTQLRPHNQTLITVGFGLMGFTMMPLLPTALEAAVELSYPTPEVCAGAPPN